MPDNAKTRRWPVVVGAVLIQLCLGAIYAWSVFASKLKDAEDAGGGGWSNAKTQIVFSVGLAMFALVMVFAGRKLTTWGPQRLAIIGGLLLGAGYAIGGIGGGTNFWVVLIGVGFIGGAGIGLGYVVPIAVGMRWFPDRKGMISGVAVAGFGFGALLWIKLAGNWGDLLESIGIGWTFVIYGGVFAALVVVGSTMMKMPPAGWLPAGYTPPEKTASGGAGFSPKEMLRTPQFYLIFLTFMASAGVGLMATGLMKQAPIDSLMSGSALSESQAKGIAETAAAVFFALANGIGRLVWGAVSDRLGRKPSLFILTATQGVVLLLFMTMAQNEATLYLAATLIGFNFGGNFALFPSLTADKFGNDTVGRNYPWVFLSYGAGGIIFPILAGRLGDLERFPLAYTIAGISCLVAAALIAMVFTPSHEEAAKPFTWKRFVGSLNLPSRARV
jgi:OFA family oxalate/formate antiporter-like MFS transporter